jgi:hypothetical protein
MSGTKDAEFAGGVALTSAAIAAKGTAVGSLATTLAANAGAVSSAAGAGGMIAGFAFLAPFLPFVAIGTGAYALYRFAEEESKK